MILFEIFHRSGGKFVFRGEDVSFGDGDAGMTHACGDVTEWNAKGGEVGGEGPAPGVGRDELVLVSGLVLASVEDSYSGVNASFTAYFPNRTVKRAVGVLVLPGFFEESRQPLFQLDGGFLLGLLADVRYVLPVDIFLCHGEDVGMTRPGVA